MPKIHALFGGEAVVIYNRNTREIVSLLTVVGECGLEESSESVDLTGGNYDAPVKSEKGSTTYDLNLTAKELSDGMFRVIKDAKIIKHAADSQGHIGDVEDLSGTMAQYLTITPLSGKEENLPFGRVQIEVTSAGKAKFFVLGSLKQGQAGWKDEHGAVTDEISFAAEGSIQLEDLGLAVQISSEAALEVGDRVEFEVRPVNTSGSVEIEVGNSAPKEYGVMFIYPRQSDGSMNIMDLPRVKFNSALPISMKEREFAEHSLSGKPMVDELTGVVYTFYRVNAR